MSISDHILQGIGAGDLAASPVESVSMATELIALRAAAKVRAIREGGHACGYCDIGSYEGQIELAPPSFLARPDGRGICVDVCLALEISRLWALGIKTTGCCCGHGKLPAFIGVTEEHISAMKAMGYSVQPNPMRPGDEDSFVPKTPLRAIREGDGEFQGRVAEAHHALFHDDPTDIAERRDRFGEEANELQQALGQTREDAHRLVDYTYDRPAGEPEKEIGAAALTLASLCVIGGWDMMACAKADLAALKTPEKIAKVRAKRATRHGRGSLPGFDSPAATGGEKE